MKNITVSVDEETHRLARIRAAELDTSVSSLVRQFLRSLIGSSSVVIVSVARNEKETAVDFRPRDLDEVLADFDARGVGVSERLTREELYDEAINGPNPLR
jgi:plasmid stability protein